MVRFKSYLDPRFPKNVVGPPLSKLSGSAQITLQSVMFIQ